MVAPDVFAVDVNSDRAWFTLLRSPRMAHHEPATPRFGSDYADQGVHVFRFRFFYCADVTEDTLERHALMLQRPLLAADLTRGMMPTAAA